MFCTRQHLLLLVSLSALLAVALAELPEDNIKEDVIKIENETQKVIRVNPLELPSKQDRTGNNMNSEFIHVQTLRPRHRHYMDSRRMRPTKMGSMGEATGEATHALKNTYTSQLKGFPKQKLQTKKHLPYPIDTEEELPVRVAPGDYPIYYVVSKTNGRFGKFPIKAFQTPAQFRKYLIKSKAEPIPRSQRFEFKVQQPTEASVISR